MPQDFPDWVAGVSPGGSFVYGSTPDNLAPAGQFQTPRVDVSAFTSLIVEVTSSAAENLTVAQDWWTASTGGQFTAHTQDFYKNTDLTTFYPQIVLGPWWQLTIINNGAANTTVSTRLLGFSSLSELHPADVITPDPLIVVNGGTFGAGGPQYPTVMLPGGMRYWFQDDAVASQLFNIQYWDGTAWSVMFSVTCATSPLPQDGRFVAPLSDWRVEVISATTTAYMGVIPD